MTVDERTEILSNIRDMSKMFDNLIYRVDINKKKELKKEDDEVKNGQRVKEDVR